MLIDTPEGEQTAHACESAWLRQSCVTSARRFGAVSWAV